MTSKQQAAKERNWMILRLRGMYSNTKCLNFTKPEMTQMQIIIDHAITRLNAEGEHTRCIRQREERTKFEEELDRIAYQTSDNGA